jgi:plasmid maintenance system antidote protein VapI
MTDFEAFIKANNLLKKDIAEYLDVSNAFVTQLCSGARTLPSQKFALIKSNNRGWDISMLQEENSETSKEKSIDSVYRELLDEKDARITELKERILELKDTISILKIEKGIPLKPAAQDAPSVFVQSQNL